MNRGNTVCGKFGGMKFWQITTGKGNGKEYFGESDDRSSVVSLHL